MKRSNARRAVATLVLGVAGLWAGAAIGAGDVNGFAGGYQGFFMNTIGGLTAGNFTMTLSGSHNRQLEGTLTAASTTVPFHVTIGASNVFTAVSGGPFGFVVHGNVTDFGDGSSISTADYKLRGPAGNEGGTLVFLQSFNTSNPSQLPPSMSGRFLRDDGQTGDLSLRLSQKGSEFQGVAMFAGIPFPFVGTIGAGNPPAGDKAGSAPVHAISVSLAGTLTIDGSFSNGILIGMMKGSLADGSVHTASFQLVPAVQLPRDG